MLSMFGRAMLEAVLPTLGTVIGGLVVGILQKQLKRAKIDLTTAQTDQLRKLVEDAVLAVEEKSRREHAEVRAAVASGVQDEHEARQLLRPMDGPDKRAEAIATVESHAPWAPASLVERLIDATLQRVRPQLLEN